MTSLTNELLHSTQNKGFLIVKSRNVSDRANTRILMTKEFGLVFVEVLKEISEVLHNHVGIVVRLKEPVILLVVVLVDVLEGVLGLVPQMVPALSDVELDC